MTENVSTETQTSPTAEYEPLKVDFTPTPAVVPLIAWTWNTPVIPQFYWNVYSAEQRIKQICLEIGRIQEYLNYFAAHYNKMSGYLNKRIDKLTAAMYAEVERLDKAIEEENKARKLADDLLQKGLDAEIARAKAAEFVLQQNIDTNTTLIEDEEKRAKDAEEKLTTDLHDETAARIAEDKKISDTVETNRQHAEEVDTQLFDSIRTEANLRKNADNLLNDRIDKETEERKADDASINTRINDEHAERVKTDNELDKRITNNQQDIEHEVERAKSAETNLNDALEREIDARVDTDRSLENSIDANERASKERDNKLQGNIDANDADSKNRDKQLQANIDAEITNRGNAENAINDRITNEVNDRKADDASINTRIDKEVEERKNDVTNLNTRVDTEQTDRVKADNALDKRATDNAQAIEHETERAKSAETNLNDALEREVDARKDDTRNLENQIDKANNDSKSRDGVLQSHIEEEATKRATEDNKKVSVTNIKAAENSRITVKTSNENTENATVTIGDTFNADFNKVNTDIETEKQRAIAKENELIGKVEHETQERQTETTALNAEVAKRPTLDKFIAGDNIILTPDIDKTTLTIHATTDENKVNDLADAKLENYKATVKDLIEERVVDYIPKNSLIAGAHIEIKKDYPNYVISVPDSDFTDMWHVVNDNNTNIKEVREDIKNIDEQLKSTIDKYNLNKHLTAGENIIITPNEDATNLTISAKNGVDADTLKDMQQNIGKNHNNIENLQSDMSSLIANSNIHGDKYIKVEKTSDNNNRLEYNLSFDDSYATSAEPDSLLTLIKKDVLGDVSTTVQQKIPELLQTAVKHGDGILINKGSDDITISNNAIKTIVYNYNNFTKLENAISIVMDNPNLQPEPFFYMKIPFDTNAKNIYIQPKFYYDLDSVTTPEKILEAYYTINKLDVKTLYSKINNIIYVIAHIKNKDTNIKFILPDIVVTSIYQ